MAVRDPVDGPEGGRSVVVGTAREDARSQRWRRVRPGGGPPPEARGPGAAGPAAAAPPAEVATVLRAEGLHVRYPGRHALRGLTLDVPAGQITAIIGPAGSGKTTFLRSLNRMNDRVPGISIQGRLLFRGLDIHAPSVDPAALRRRIGMIFQRPVVLPMSVFDNVAYAARIHRLERDAAGLWWRVERCLREAGLWDEVKDRLRRPAALLSAGQRQRLAVARALAVDPEVILLDEPTSAADPVATGRIEDTLVRLSGRFTFVLVTHNLGQAARISQHTAFLLGGELVEAGATAEVFSQPRDARTEQYLTGRFG